MLTYTAAVTQAVLLRGLPLRRIEEESIQDIYMYTCNCRGGFSGIPLRARTFIQNVRWGGHNSTVGATLPEVWARSVQRVARGKPFKPFGLGHT